MIISTIDRLLKAIEIKDNFGEKYKVVVNNGLPYLYLKEGDQLLGGYDGLKGYAIAILAEEMGMLENSLSRMSFFRAVDYLWNIHNRKITFSNGNVKVNVITELNTRLDSFQAWPYTEILLNQVAQIKPDTHFDFRLYNMPAFDSNGDEYRYSFITTSYSNLSGRSALVPRYRNLTNLGYTYFDEIGWYPTHEEIVNVNGIDYPRSYVDEHMVPCQECGNPFNRDDLIGGVCSNCLGVSRQDLTVHGYSERATAHFTFKVGKYNKHLFKEPLFFGIELEYETDNQPVALVKSAILLKGHAIFKRDGSINNGFEIVTAPATRDIHESVFNEFFNKFPENLIPHSTCGMHVHVSRAPLSILTQGKMVEFMNREENKEFLKKIAGRWSDHYANNDPSRTITFPFVSQSGGNRYNTLNVCNSSTLEFRIFASTKKWNEFISRLEFCDAVAHYCSPFQSKAPSLKDATKWMYFAQYVADNRKQFPNLFSSL